MIPRVRTRVSEAEDLRRMPPQTFEELLDRKLLRIAQPAMFGGVGLDIDEVYQLGFQLAPVTVPDPAELNVIGRVILYSEASAVLQPFLNRRTEFSPDVLALIEEGRRVFATDYIDAQRLRRVHQARWARVWDEVDVVFTPTTPVQAPLIGETQVAGEDVRLASTRFARPFNVLGIPALSIPLSTGDMPVGLQMVAPAGREADVLHLAALIAS